MVGRSAETPVQFVLKAPQECNEEELERFEELVADAAEVQTAGRFALIRKALMPAFAIGEDGLVGVGELKRPRESYRKKVFRKSGTSVEAILYQLELGWISVRKGFRGHGLGTQISELLMSKAEEPVYATMRERNTGMRRISEDLGFHLDGQPYQGREDTLVIYLWEPA